MYRNSKHTVLFPLILAAGLSWAFSSDATSGATTRPPRSGACSTASPRRAENSPTRSRSSRTATSIRSRWIRSPSMSFPLLVRELDPHSVYIPASEMAALNEPLEGEFDGVGVVFNMATDTVIVLNVIPRGPSDKAGVKAGDRILTINDSLVAGRKIPQNNIVRKLRGPRGSKVRLRPRPPGHRGAGRCGGRARRHSAPQHRVGLPHRRQHRIHQARAVRPHDRRRASGGARHAAQAGCLEADLRPARQFGRLPRPGDRRGQRIPPRGAADRLYRGQAPQAAARICRRHGYGPRHGACGAHRRGERLVERDPSPERSRTTTGGRSSAAARSARASCSSRSPMPTARPCGSPRPATTRRRDARSRSPTRSATRPPTKRISGTATATTRFFSADSIHFVDSLKRVTPGGKVVYGGGGIMPDVFVPIDTTGVSKYFPRGGRPQHPLPLYDRVFDRHRDALNAVRSVDELQALLDSDTSLFDDFIRYAAPSGASRRVTAISPSRGSSWRRSCAPISAATRPLRTTDSMPTSIRGQRHHAGLRDSRRKGRNTMIRRIFGWVLVLATLAVIVFAVINRGNYHSMFAPDATAAAGEQSVEQPES